MSAVASCPRCNTVLDCPHCPPESPESHERGGKATTQPADATNPPWPPPKPGSHESDVLRRREINARPGVPNYDEYLTARAWSRANKETP